MYLSVCQQQQYVVDTVVQVLFHVFKNHAQDWSKQCRSVHLSALYCHFVLELQCWQTNDGWVIRTI